MTYEQFVQELANKAIYRKVANDTDWKTSDAVRKFVGFVADEMKASAKITPEIEDDIDAATLEIVVANDVHWAKVWKAICEQTVSAAQISSFDITSMGTFETTATTTPVADDTIQKIVDMVIWVIKQFS